MSNFKVFKDYKKGKYSPTKKKDGKIWKRFKTNF